MKYKRRIRFGETDPFGVAYFTTYFDIFKEALDEFLRYKGINPKDFYRNPIKNYAFPIIYAEGRFFKPLRFDDEIEISVEVDKIGESSIVFKFKGTSNSHNVCEGRVVCVCIDKNWKKRNIPEDIIRILS